MKLEYKILWFDNDPEIFDSMEDEIAGLEETIRSWGFVPQVTKVSEPDEFIGHAPYSDIDLVVVDFNLEEHGEGQEFIARLRTSTVFTEVIFYSAQAAEQLWDAVRQKQLEGIYIAHKDNIVSRIIGVGEHTLRKVLDLENMRGIVMAEVGDLDQLLEKIFVLAMQDVPEKGRTSVFEKFHEDACRGVSKQQQALDDFQAAPSVEKLLGLCDSAKRWASYRRVRKVHEHLRSFSVGDYQSEVLTPRNALAHGIPSTTEDGSLRFNHHGNIFAFNEATSRELRHTIIKYRVILEEVREALAAGPRVPHQLA